MGILLLAFGLQWLRKAVLRASGRKAKRDENMKFAQEVEEAREPSRSAFAVGVMLTSFGVFWIVEGARIHWPGGDAMLPLLVAALSAWAAVYRIRRAPEKLDA